MPTRPSSVRFGKLTLKCRRVWWLGWYSTAHSLQSTNDDGGSDDMRVCRSFQGAAGLEGGRHDRNKDAPVVRRLRLGGGPGGGVLQPGIV